jgi:hypothetical protein
MGLVATSCTLLSAPVAMRVALVTRNKKNDQKKKTKNTVAMRVALVTRKYTKKHECADEQALTQN